MSLGTTYNLNPANITIGANSITINHTGLYHFEGLADASVTFISVPSAPPRFALQLHISNPTVGYELMYGALTTQFSTLTYVKAERFYIDLQITAGSVLSLQASYSFGGSTNTTGWFTGYLISD